MSEDIFSQFFNLFNNNDSEVNWELSKQINKQKIDFIRLGVVADWENPYTSMDKDILRGKMPVSPKHLQPAGILHGGATLSLAETIGSAASNIFIDNPSEYIAVGQEIAANHLKSIQMTM